MKNNKGFTLVELLAVIAILAMLAIITLPNVVSMFNEAKQNSFNTEVKNIYKTAQQKWMNDSMFKSDEKVYCINNIGHVNGKLLRTAFAG
jgi:type IV pilus assembly protein PilA